MKTKLVLFVLLLLAVVAIAAVSPPYARLAKTCDDLRDSLPSAFQTTDAQSNGDAQRNKIRRAQASIGEDMLRRFDLDKPFTDFIQAGRSLWPQQANEMQTAYKSMMTSCDAFEWKYFILVAIGDLIGKFSTK